MEVNKNTVFGRDRFQGNLFSIENESHLQIIYFTLVIGQMSFSYKLHASCNTVVILYNNNMINDNNIYTVNNNTYSYILGQTNTYIYTYILNILCMLYINYISIIYFAYIYIYIYIYIFIMYQKQGIYVSLRVIFRKRNISRHFYIFLSDIQS